MTDQRPVAVTSGAAEVRSIKITELNGVDISGDAFTACVSPLGVVPPAGDFHEPDDLSFGTEGSGDDLVHFAMVGVLVSSGNATPGADYVVCAKFVDAPETPVLFGPSFPVI